MNKHLKPLNLIYLNLLAYCESIYTSKPGTPGYAVEEQIYQSWNDWVDDNAERTEMLGKGTKKSKIFEGMSNIYENSSLINISNLTVSQLQACPKDLLVLINEVIATKVEYLIVIVP